MKVFALAMLIVAASTTLLPSIESKPVQKTIALGGHSLGEKLRDFQSAFPNTICGSPLHEAEVMSNTEIRDRSRLLGCCLDNPEEISKFSSFKILFVGRCHVLATFYSERLQELRYTVEVPTFDRLLSGFEEAYGPSTLDTPMKFDGVHPKRVIGWLRGEDMLDLVSSTVGVIVLKSGSTIVEEPNVDLVLIHLWKMEP